MAPQYSVVVFRRRATGIFHTITVQAPVLVGDVGGQIISTGAHEKKRNAAIAAAMPGCSACVMAPVIWSISISLSTRTITFLHRFRRSETSKKP